MKDLRNVIKEKRKKLGWNRKDLAEKVGVHYSTILEMETGKRVKTVRRHILTNILNVLDINTDELGIDIEPFVNDFKVPVFVHKCQNCGSQTATKEILLSEEQDLKLVLCKNHRKRLASKLITSL